MQVLNIFHVLIAIALIAFVLVQRGQGATAGAAFGSGASGTVFGARGAGNFLSRSTWVLAALFCAISLTMAVLVSRMMEAPDTDLGVVTAPQQTEPAPAPATEELTPAGDEQGSSDLPGAAADDLPSSEAVEAPAAEEAPQPMSGEDLPPPDNAGASEEPAGDGN